MLWKGTYYQPTNWCSALHWQPGEKTIKDVKADGTWDININASTLVAPLKQTQKKNKPKHSKKEEQDNNTKQDQKMVK